MRPIVLSLTLLLTGTASAGRAQNGSAAAPPSVILQAVGYDWGTRFYADELTDHFEFVNKCDRPVVVAFDTREAPFLNVATTVNAAPGANNIPIKLKPPSWPTEPGCLDLIGVLTVESAGYEGEQSVCQPSRSSHTVTVHVHWWDRTGPPPTSKAGGPDACTTWWNTGHPPPFNPNAWDKACGDTVRHHALWYRQRVLDPRALKSPSAWAWLPTAPEIRNMTVAELLAMRDRAALQVSRSPGN